MLKEYYHLTKPGIVRGNLITASGGFFLASYGSINLVTLFAVLFGTGFVIASACVFNNYIDRELDAQMKRTKKRALVEGRISTQSAIVFGSVLGILGTLALLLFSNVLATIVAITGFIFYVVVYGHWKRKSIHGTLVGSISGAIPPVIGYTAVASRIDIGAILLFLILVVWQMPHFYAIGIYRISEYKHANLPLLPIVKGIYLTKVHMMVYIFLFVIFVSLLTALGYTGYIFLFVMIILGVVWLFKGIQGFDSKDESLWAKGVFSYSLLILTIFSILISIDFVLPF